MNLLDASTAMLQQSFYDIGNAVLLFLPSFLVALIILLIGWIIGAGLGRVVARGITALKVDNALRNAGVEDLLSRSGVHLNAGAFLGALIKWFVIAVFLIAALDVLGLTQVNDFLSAVVVGFLPDVIVAVLILLVAAVIAEVVQNVVVGAARTAQMNSAVLLGSMAKWAIWVFAILAALNQLNVAQFFVQTIFTSIAIAMGLAFGLAFGLGSQDAAKRAVERFEHEIVKRR